MKVLPENKVPLANGWVLHDCHAEGFFDFGSLLCSIYICLADGVVVAIRGFNWYTIFPTARGFAGLITTSQLPDRGVSKTFTGG